MNSLIENIATALLLAFAIGVPSCKQARASLPPHFEDEASNHQWRLSHNPKLGNDFSDILGSDFSDTLRSVFLHYKKGQENLSKLVIQLQKTTGSKLTNDNRQNLTKPDIQIIFGVHKSNFANSTHTHEANPANRPYSSVNVRKSSAIVHKRFASRLNNGYDKDLSKKHVSGQPIRYLSAFFVPVICLASQAKQFISTLNNLSQVKTVISKMIYSSNSYDGVTLQNTKALGQICRAVADVTESEPHHPMIFHSVVSTQKTTSGGSYHG